MNGWKRLWVVATLGSLIWFGVLYPLSYFPLSDAEVDYARSIKRDYDSGKCDRYINADFASLTEPPFDDDGGKCWHIYTSRKHDLDDYGDKIPYTFAVYDENRWAWHLNEVLKVAAVFSIATIIVSMLVYLAGLIVAWVARGFRTTATKVEGQ